MHQTMLVRFDEQPVIGDALLCCYIVPLLRAFATPAAEPKAEESPAERYGVHWVDGGYLGWCVNHPRHGNVACRCTEENAHRICNALNAEPPKAE